jgi:hypothetical protein
VGLAGHVLGLLRPEDDTAAEPDAALLPGAAAITEMAADDLVRLALGRSGI